MDGESCAVYVIWCRLAGGAYVGSTRQPGLRYRGHLRLLERGCHPNQGLQEAFDTHGAAGLEFQIVERPPVGELGECEREWFRRLSARDGLRLYNRCEPGHRHAPGEVRVSDEFRVLVTGLKSLADRTRLRILGLVAIEERSVEELAVLLGVTPPTISWHLAQLKESGLVQMRVEGTTHLYRVNRQGLRRIDKLLGALQHWR